MTTRNGIKEGSEKLVALIEQRFGIFLDTRDTELLMDVSEHYREKREMLLREHGEVGALKSDDYAKAVLLSEAARLALREIAPKRRKKIKKG